MVTPAQMRKIALALPETEEKSHFGKPDFRVRGKIFAGLSLDEKVASMKMPLELQTMLLGAKPQAFSPAEGAWGRSGWTYVDLAHVEVEELRELVVEAWRLIAPRGATRAPPKTKAKVVSAKGRTPTKKRVTPAKKAVALAKRVTKSR